MLIEDDKQLSEFMIDVVHLLNCTVLGPFATMIEGLKHANESMMDMAILDISLPGGNSIPIAEMLRTRNIPFFFTSGDSEATIPGFDDVLRLPKPSNLEIIEDAIKQTLCIS
jgi:DNA-binding response OmpR family regulator